MLPKKVLAVSVVRLIIVEGNLKVNKAQCRSLQRDVSFGLVLQLF